MGSGWVSCPMRACPSFVPPAADFEVLLGHVRAEPVGAAGGRAAAEVEVVAVAEAPGVREGCGAGLSSDKAAADAVLAVPLAAIGIGGAGARRPPAAGALQAQLSFAVVGCRTARPGDWSEARVRPVRDGSRPARTAPIGVAGARAAPEVGGVAVRVGAGVREESGAGQSIDLASARVVLAVPQAAIGIGAAGGTRRAAAGALQALG